MKILSTDKRGTGNKRQENFIKLFICYLYRKFAEALSDHLPIEKNLASLTKSDLEKINELIHEFK